MAKIEPIYCDGAPKPLGNYAHAVRHGDLIFVSGIASRDFVTDEIPGLVLDEKGNRVRYDIKRETRATLENIDKILRSAGSSLKRVIDVSVYLLDMNDFAAYNEIYAEFFHSHRPARTTVAVSGLPGKIAIEMKVVASAKDAD